MITHCRVEAFSRKLAIHIVNLKYFSIGKSLLASIISYQSILCIDIFCKRPLYLSFSGWQSPSTCFCIRHHYNQDEIMVLSPNLVSLTCRSCVLHGGSENNQYHQLRTLELPDDGWRFVRCSSRTVLSGISFYWRLTYSTWDGSNHKTLDFISLFRVQSTLWWCDSMAICMGHKLRR